MLLTGTTKPEDHFRNPGVTRVPIPWRLTRVIDAEVHHRWVANVVVPPQVVRRLVLPAFLEPITVAGKPVLSLCAIFMRHAGDRRADG